MRIIDEITLEAHTVAYYLRGTCHGVDRVSHISLEQHGTYVAVAYWNGLSYEHVQLVCPVPAAQRVLALGGLEGTRLLWRYQDAVLDALSNNSNIL